MRSSRRTSTSRPAWSGRSGRRHASRALVRLAPHPSHVCAHRSRRRARDGGGRPVVGVRGAEATIVLHKRQFLTAKDVTKEKVSRPSINPDAVYDIWANPDGPWLLPGPRVLALCGRLSPAGHAVRRWDAAATAERAWVRQPDGPGQGQDARDGRKDARPRGQSRAAAAPWPVVHAAGHGTSGLRFGSPPLAINTR